MLYYFIYLGGVVLVTDGPTFAIDHGFTTKRNGWFQGAWLWTPVPKYPPMNDATAMKVGSRHGHTLRS